MSKVGFLPKTALAASLMLAVTFMFSCSGEDKDSTNCIIKPKTDSTNGYDVFCNGEKTGELFGLKDLECIVSPQFQKDSILVICNGEKIIAIPNSNGCDIEDGDAYIEIKCGDAESTKFPKATCGENAYNPAKMECNKDILSFSFTDARDSTKYKAVIIGTQTWMAENLNYGGKPDSALGKCYAEGVSGVSQDSIAKNCAKYGRLYNWATAMGLDDSYNSTLFTAPAKHKGICPDDWHVPTSAEWSTLINSIGGAATAGIKLRAANGWNNGNGTDDYGFSALPGGYSSYSNASYSFSYIGSYGYWWRATSNNATTALHWYINYNSSNIQETDSPNKTHLLSVRCIKD